MLWNAVCLSHISDEEMRLSFQLTLGRNKERISDALSKNFLVTEGGGEKKKSERNQGTNEVKMSWEKARGARRAGWPRKEASFHYEEKYSWLLNVGMS